MGNDEQFINMVKFLFRNASVAINLNGTPSRNFKMERGIRQGCPLPTSQFPHCW